MDAGERLTGKEVCQSLGATGQTFSKPSVEAGEPTQPFASSPPAWSNGAVTTPDTRGAEQLPSARPGRRRAFNGQIRDPAPAKGLLSPGGTGADAGRLLPGESTTSSAGRGRERVWGRHRGESSCRTRNAA